MANNLDILDAAGATKTVKSTDNASVHTPHHIIDSGTITTVSTVTTVSAVTALGTITPGTAATSLGKAEDAAHTSGDVGVMSLAVRNDAGTATAADGDYHPLMVNSAGALYVTGGGGGTQYAEDAAHVSGNTGTLALVVRSDTAASTAGTDGDYAALITNSTGHLWTAAVQSGTWTVTGAGGSFPITDSGGSITVDNGGTFAVQAVCTNAGTFAVQVDGNALTALQLIDDTIFTDDAAFTPGTSKVSMVGFQCDETATDSVDEGDAGAARITPDRKQIVTQQPHTAGGLTIARDIDLDNGTLTVVKASAGQLYGYTVTNTTASTVYVKFYDAASGTLGTGTPAMTIGIPGNSTDDVMVEKTYGGHGVAFATGICVGAGTGVGDADNTDPGANAVVANIFYK